MTNPRDPVLVMDKHNLPNCTPRLDDQHERTKWSSDYWVNQVSNGMSTANEFELGHMYLSMYLYMYMYIYMCMYMYMHMFMRTCWSIGVCKEYADWFCG